MSDNSGAANRPGAVEIRGTEKQIVHARPVEGEIDHAALTREIIAKYPKILEALAK